MNEFLTWATRWTVRIIMLTLGVVFFLCLLSVACVLAAFWMLRAVWAKFTGQTVRPWVMPMRAATSWANLYQRAGQFGGMGAAQAPAEPAASPFSAPSGSKRGGILAKAASDVSDVQPRHVQEQ